MSKETIVRDRTIAKELRLAEKYVLSAAEVRRRGYTLLGSTGTAAHAGYLTIRQIENKGTVITPSEIANCTTYAMMKMCPTDFCIYGDNGKRVRPCIPVFRTKEANHAESTD